MVENKNLTCESCGTDFKCKAKKNLDGGYFFYPKFFTIVEGECNPFCSKTCKDIFDK